MRDAVDAAIAGVTLEEIQTLDMGTQRAQTDISATLVDLKENTSEHTSFMREIAKMQKAAAKEFGKRLRITVYPVWGFGATQPVAARLR
jgi:L-fucose isomerase-like protein